jgi:hypothetical protein
MLCVRCLTLTLVLVLTITASAAPPGPADLDHFERHVRPVLVENCMGCHGPKKQMGGLRVDSLAAVLKGGDNGPAIRPGEPANSLLIQAVRRTADVKMPPKKVLPEVAVRDLEEWVKRGAVWPKTAPEPPREAWKTHWAFLPVRDPPLPAIKDGAWPRTSIDYFIAAELEKHNLTPSPEADRRTLIRRLSFDLLGLPRAPAEVADFESDTTPNAYERLVDRLLASPHYGERWGRHWLDVARYADTKGYVFFEENKYPWAWTYRDWVIRAFNEDRPYDQFILQQLAADQVPGGDRHDLCALGFLTVGDRFMNNVQDILDDRIDVVCRGLMALTVGCARCHDHKFDPIPTADYYSLYGTFASCREPEVSPLFDGPPATKQYESFAKELQKREGQLDVFLHGKYDAVTTAARARVADYMLASHSVKDQPTMQDFMLIADGGDLSPFMLKRWRAFLVHSRKGHHRVFAPWHAFAALPAKDFTAGAAAICSRLASPSGGDAGVNPIIAHSFAAKPPASLADAAHRYGELLNAADRQWQDACKAAKGAPPQHLPDPAQEELRQVFWGPESPPNIPFDLINRLDLLPDRASQGELQKFLKAVEDWRMNGPGAPPRAMVVVDSPHPYEPHVFVRGNPGNIGPAVPRRAPAVIAGPDRKPFTHGSGRLDLANSIIDPKNPLTARVLVNRIWAHHFGKPLVATPSDFGMRSERPTHPELLDHLATVFVRDGWSIKRLHRRILLSAAYRQQALDRPEARATDPGNIWLWRMERRRLDFESLRDALLVVAGRLEPAIGGKSVADNFAPPARRRTLYGHLDRLQVPGLYRAFDFPSPDATAAQRDRTTIPQQALFLMNHPLVLECARATAARPEVAGAPDLEHKVTALYQLLFNRPPMPPEIELARRFRIGTPGGLDWPRYAQGLLLANEFAFVD